MTLALLRRLVLACSGISFLGAGTAAWFSLQGLPSVRPPESWMEYFPVKKSGGSDAGPQGPAPVTEYLEAIKWPQGEKPVVKVEGPAAPPPPVETFQYRLTGFFVSDAPGDSFAQIQATSPPGPSFSLRVGEQVPAAPGSEENRVLDWRLEAVKLGGPRTPASALFRNLESGEEKTLTVDVSLGATDLLAGGSRGRDGEAGGGTGLAKPSRQMPRYVALLARTDPAKGHYEFEVPEEEMAYLQENSTEEAKKVDVISAEDGLIIKGMAPDSRARSMGFKAEDRVISVNGEKVTSTDQALGVGRRQYDSGTGIFVVKVIRTGKEMNFTFHAPKKKGGKK